MYFPVITSKVSVDVVERSQYTKNRKLHSLLKRGDMNISVNLFKFINDLVYLTDYDKMSLIVELSF